MRLIHPNLINMKYTWFFLSFLFIVGFTSCKKDDASAKLRVQFAFNPTQERLDNFGQPTSGLPIGHAAQVPDFHGMSAHFIEFAPNNLTPYGGGEEIYKGAEVTAPNGTAIDFNSAIVSDEGVAWLEIPLNEIAPGSYDNVRVSVAYQNYDVNFDIINLPLGIPDLQNQGGTVASFLGFNTYIQDVTPRNTALTVNDGKEQGYWAFETALTGIAEPYNRVIEGEAPEGATTVVNPFPTPIPAGSCVVGGAFIDPLVITGTETEDITLTLSFSINNSFEWIDSNGNGRWDVDGSNFSAEQVVDMGLRGLEASWN